MGVRVLVGDREPVGLALRRLKVALEQAGVGWEMRQRAYFVAPSQRNRAQRFQRRFKARRATLLAQRAGQQPVSSLAEATKEFWKRTGKP